MREMMVIAALVAGCGQATDVDEQSVTSDMHGEGRGHAVRVMTRNLYLGADLAPAIGAPDLGAFVAGTGAVVRQVTATNFPVRARGLADEILGADPDLVGLQEVALWRVGPPSIAPLLGGGNTASTVRYDYLALLLAELNCDEERYRPVMIEEEFDLEAPADENGVAGDGPPPIVNAELNVRLTMRDVILARVSGGVHVSDPRGGHFAHPLVLSILGAPLAVTRGWTSVEARVRGATPFRFVNTHLEAYEATSRAAQAAELVAPGGPAASTRPVVLVGDLNSDDNTVPPADQQAYRTLLAAGLVERTDAAIATCCIGSYDLTTGTAAEFTQQIDHVMTNAPSKVRLIDASVTGREMANGYWDSDHAGVTSTLQIR